MGEDVGANSAVVEEALGEGVERVGDGRLPSGEDTASVGVTGVEVVQAARNDSRRQPFITAIFILRFCNCLTGFI